VQRGIRPASAPVYLGIDVDWLRPGLGVQTGGLLGPNQGVIVENVDPDSPAARGGLQQYDILATLDGQKLSSPDQFAALLSGPRNSRFINFGIVRGGKPLNVVVAVESATPPLPAGVANPAGPPTNVLPPVAPVEVTSSDFGQFDSMTIRKTGPNRYHVSADYLDRSGFPKKHQFDARSDEVIRAVESNLASPAAQAVPVGVAPVASTAAPLPGSGLPPLFHRHHGYVESTGVDRISLMKVYGNVWTFRVAPNARILRGGKPARLGDLRPYDVVTVTEQDSVATRIDARPVSLYTSGGGDAPLP
jgi:hypothetical protein